MGTLYSRQKATLSDYLGLSGNDEDDGPSTGVGVGVGGMVDGAATNAKKPIIAPIKKRINIDLLSQQEMEQEFDKIYQTSQQLLNSLTHNPCEQLALRVQECLASNSQEMANCFAVMNSYKSCLADQREEKLLKSLRNFEMN